MRWAETYLAGYNDFGTFVAALQDRTLRDRIMEWSYFRPMHVWLCHPGETVSLADFVGRFETLSEDMAALAERLGITANLPHRRSPLGYLEKKLPPDMVDIVGTFTKKISGYLATERKTNFRNYTIEATFTDCCATTTWIWDYHGK